MIEIDWVESKKNILCPIYFNSFKYIFIFKSTKYTYLIHFKYLKENFLGYNTFVTQL